MSSSSSSPPTGQKIRQARNPAQPGNPAQSGPAPATLRATAGRAVYEGAGEWLHLLVNPRVESGALQLTADKLDISQASGDAFARGNVKATWTGEPASPETRTRLSARDLALAARDRRM